MAEVIDFETASNRLRINCRGVPPVKTRAIGDARPGIADASEEEAFANRRRVLIDVLRREAAEVNAAELIEQLERCERISCGLAACPECQAYNDRRLFKECRRILASEPDALLISAHWDLPLCDLKQVRQYDVMKLRQMIVTQMGLAGLKGQRWRGRIKIKAEQEPVDALDDFKGSCIVCSASIEAVTIAPIDCGTEKRVSSALNLTKAGRWRASSTFFNRGGGLQERKYSPFLNEDIINIFEERHDIPHLVAEQRTEAHIALSFGRLTYRDILLPAPRRDIDRMLGQQ